MEFVGPDRSPYAVQVAENTGDEVVYQQIGSSKLSRVRYRGGFVCCSSNLRYLNETPIVVPTYLLFGFVNPGDYLLFMQTMRVSGPNGIRADRVPHNVQCAAHHRSCETNSGLETVNCHNQAITLIENRPGQ